MSDWELVITGCGTSHGNPPWGYPDYWSDDPRDRRRRSGALLRGPQGEVILIDVGPDLANQLTDPYRDWDGITYPQRCVTRCDGVLFTHAHADHLHGLNELRHLNRLMDGQPITIFGFADHLDTMVASFPYCFAGGDGPYHIAKPALVPSAIEWDRTWQLHGLPVTPFAMSHGPAGPVTGFRIGSIAYCTDCKQIPESNWRFLQNLDLLVIDMLRQEVHPTHMNLDEALAMVEVLKPKRTVFVHMGYEVYFASLAPRLPAGVELAYDGWTSPFSAKGPHFAAKE